MPEVQDRDREDDPQGYGDQEWAVAEQELFGGAADVAFAYQEQVAEAMTTIPSFPAE